MENKTAETPFLKQLLKNIILAAIIIFALVFAVNLILKLSTNHGQIIKVPDFTNMTVKDAQKTAADLGIRVDVTDSVFVRRMGRGLVYRQNPSPGSGVKQNRRVHLTINSVTPKKVQAPNLVGLSMRQAKAEILSRGLKVGKLIYVSDIATNNVLKQLYRNNELAPGKQIESGSEISLIVGLNPDNNQTFVPDVTGLKYLRAIEVIHDNSLNAGKAKFAKEIRTYADSLDAVVVAQDPPATQEPVLMGTEVIIRLSNGTVSE